MQIEELQEENSKYKHDIKQYKQLDNSICMMQTYLENEILDIKSYSHMMILDQESAMLKSVSEYQSHLQLPDQTVDNISSSTPMTSPANNMALKKL